LLLEQIKNSQEEGASAHVIKNNNKFNAIPKVIVAK